MSEKENVWILHGDCLERMKEIPDGSVDMSQEEWDVLKSNIQEYFI